MTKNRSITVDATEIRTLEVRCTECSGMMAFPLARSLPTDARCPGCGHPFWETTNDGSIGTAIFKIHAALGTWGRIALKPLSLTFTVNDPDEK